ncbi:BURP domain-containing protein 16-like [Dorcoceras hygrometricum]|uniref:BURP domain-containing protein 16-like n=1 Tax=Dorcoceras hygrometricum TaxID=472368 RepID=A0A2Z7CUV6_9LAMI|nr:BURP domain-containing protein 16-like [Dorcoceras hygrometricum]
MPKSILDKLSPLTQNDCKYYTSMISNNVKLDSKFCSIAKLACSSSLEDVKVRRNIYVDEYQNNPSSSLSVDQRNEDHFSFFRLSVLKNGNIVHLPNLEESLPDRSFLPPQIASRIPLNTQEIAKLFPGTTKETIEHTLFYCNAAAIKGEVKSCPKSLEEMINFSKSALGGKKLISLSSKSTEGSNTEVMIKNIKKFNSDRIVACHEVFLPFAAYFCHSLPSTNLYSVDLVETKTGAPVNSLVAICHMDTSPFPANHVVFKILKLRPGQGEACHWFTQIDLAWIPNTE